MKEHWLKIKEWWSSLSFKEKQTVKLLSGMLSVFLIYKLCWSPFTDKVDVMRTQIHRNETLLAFMIEADKSIREAQTSVRPSAKTTTPIALLGVMQKQIDKMGLSQALSQLKQTDNDAIEIHFQKVSFDKLMKLLIYITNEQHATITQFSASADHEEGMANADLMLRI